MRCLLLFTCSFFGILASAQTNKHELDIAFYADVMTNASEYNHRLLAYNKVNNLMEKFLTSSNTNVNELDSIPHIKTLHLGKNLLVSFKVADELGIDVIRTYFVNERGMVVDFKGRDNLEDIEFETLNPSIGYIPGLYYFAKPFKLKNIQDTAYLLFSYAQIDEFTKRKVVDVLYFQDGEPRLGGDAFVYEKENTRDFVVNRLIFQYSKDVVMAVSYSKDRDAIIIDHLVEVRGRIPGQGSMMVPDGTYSAFDYNNGNWIYNEMLYEAKRDVKGVDEVLKGGTEKKSDKVDIFGRKRN